MTSVPAPTAAAPFDPPVVAATWQERAAGAAWLPPELAPHLGDALAWLAEVAYQDADAVASDLSGWRVAAATRRGRVHAHAGDHREDAYAVVRTGGTVIAVASDGAGSARFSRVGAEVTCRETARAAAAALAGGDASGETLGAALSAGVHAACEALRALAERAGASPKDFRCTVLGGIL